MNARVPTRTRIWPNLAADAEIELLDIIIKQKTRVFSFMLFTVPSTGGFKEKHILVLKILTKKSAKQENYSLFTKSIL